MDTWPILKISALTLLIFTFFIILLFKYAWTSKSSIRNLCQNLSISSATILFLYFLSELFFGVLLVQSDGLGLSISSKRWFSQYWNPINSYGYRDYEQKNNENTLFIIGDSFVAGQGVNNIENRLSGILAKKLGDKWSVNIIAQNGWGPKDEYSGLISNNIKPSKILVSYFINDIDNAAIINNIPPPAITAPGKTLNSIISNSFTANWLYWRYFTKNLGISYWEYIEKAYMDPNTWKTHKDELNKFIDYGKNNNVEVMFIVWPILADINRSSEITYKITNYLNEKNIAAIDLSPYLNSYLPSELIVNFTDAHPNEKTNKLVAEIVFSRLLKNQVNLKK